MTVRRKLKAAFTRRRRPTDELAPFVRRVVDARLTYLDEAALLALVRAVRRIEESGPSGDIIEAGCALGGSAIVMAAAKRPDRALVVYDAFGMIPAPSERDGEDVHRRYAEIAAGDSEGIAGDRYYGYEPNLELTVRRNFDRYEIPLAEHAVSLIPGLFDRSLNPKRPVALAHIDADWYDSVWTCLTRIHPHLSHGGRFIIDDYDHWSGARRAVDAFLSDYGDAYRAERDQRLQLVKRSPGA